MGEHDHLPISDRGRWRRPQRRDVGSESPDRFALFRTQRCWLLSQETTVLFLHLALRRELRFKLALEGTRDKSVFGFDSVVLPHCALNFVLSAL